jgi:MFS family permease
MARVHRGDTIPRQKRPSDRRLRTELADQSFPNAEQPAHPGPMMNALGGEQLIVNGRAPVAPPPRGPDTQEQGGYKAVLQNRKFLRLWTAQIISQTNMNAANYGLITLIATETRSLTATAGAIVAFSLPALLIGAPAGVLVDRLDRRGVLLVSNILRGLASLAFVVFLLLDRSALLPIYALTFFISMVGQFFGPAEGAAIPKLVKPKSLMNALALFNITFTVSQALGLIIVGPLILLTVPLLPGPISNYAVETLFIIIAALYFVCVWLINQIPSSDLRALPDESGGRNRRPERPWADMWGAIGQTVHYVVTRPLLTIALFQLSLAGVVTAVIAMIAPAFVYYYFGLPPQSAALVFIPAGIGLVLGAAITPRIARRFRYTRLVGAGMILVVICALGIAFTRFVTVKAWPQNSGITDPWYIGLVLGLTFILGVALDFINVPAQAKMQEFSEDYIKGRVLALQIMGLNAITIPVILIIGYVADRTGMVSVAVVLLAIFVGATGAVSLFAWVYFRRKAQRRAQAEGKVIERMPETIMD